MTDEKMEDALRALLERVEALEASRVGLTIICNALISTSARYETAQLLMTSVLEQQLGQSGVLTKGMSERQKGWIRETVEWAQMARPIDAPASQSPGSSPPTTP